MATSSLSGSILLWYMIHSSSVFADFYTVQCEQPSIIYVETCIIMCGGWLPIEMYNRCMHIADTFGMILAWLHPSLESRPSLFYARTKMEEITGKNGGKERGLGNFVGILGNVV